MTESNTTKPISNFLRTVTGQRNLDALAALDQRLDDLLTAQTQLAETTRVGQADISHRSEVGFTELTGKVQSTGQTLVSSLQDDSAQVRRELNDLLNKLRTDVRNLQGEQGEQHESVLDRMDAQLRAINGVFDQLVTSSQNLDSGLGRLGWELRDAFARQAQHISAGQLRSQREMAAKTEELLSRLIVIVEKDLDQSSRQFQQTSETWQQGIGALTDEMRASADSLQSNLTALADMQSKGLTAANSAIEASNRAALKAVEQQTSDLLASISERAEEFAAKHSEDSEHFARFVETLISENREAQAAEHLAAREWLGSELIKFRAELATLSDTQSKALTAANSAELEKVAAAVNSAIDTSAKTAEKASEKLSSELRTSLGNVQSSIDASAKTAEKASEKLSSELRTSLGNVQSSIDKSTVDQAKAVDKLSSELRTSLGNLQSRIDETSQHQISAISDLWREERENRTDAERQVALETGRLSLAPGLRPPETLDLYPPAHNLSDYEDGKVVIFGLQKAGNTWLLSLLANIFGLPPFFNVYDQSQIGKKAVISTHDPLSASIRSRADFVHCVCLVRDLRDMVSSYFHYMQTSSYQADVPKAAYADIDTFYYDWFLTRMVPAFRYHSFWEEYAEAGAPVIRYERLTADTTSELMRLFDRWGETVDRDKVEGVVKDHAFSSLKKNGRKIGSTKIEGSHFRKGKLGSYKDELPKHIIDDINTRFEHVLRRWGYEI